MEASVFALLDSGVTAQHSAIDHTFDLIEERALISGDAGLESLSFQLHNLYSACEELFEIVLEDARRLRPLLASDVDAFLATVSGESAER